MKLHVKKVSATMLQAEPDALEYLDKVKVGTILGCEMRRERNYQFLKKYMAMLQLAFDYWSPEEAEYKGQPVEKNFDRFRKDAQILAGYGTPVWNLRGELRMESQSISFASMGEEEFDKVYNDVLTVLMRNVLAARGFNAEMVNTLVDQLVDFA